MKDDRIFTLIDKSLASNQSVVRIDEPDLRMRTAAISAMPGLAVQATAAQWGDYLVLASDDALICEMIAAQKGGKRLKSAPEFARLTAGLPEQGNSFQFVSQLFAETLRRFQSELFKNQPGASPEQTAMMEKLLAFQKTGASYSVSAHLADGLLSVGKSSQGAAQLLAPLLIVPAAIAGSIAVPAFGQAHQKGKVTKSMSQAKQIALACRLYAGDNGGKFPPSLEVLVPDYLPNAGIFVSPFAPEAPMGFTYTAELAESAPATAILIEDKFAARAHLRVIAHRDGSAETVAAP